MAVGIQIKRLQSENQKLQEVIDSLVRENYELKMLSKEKLPTNEPKRT